MPRYISEETLERKLATAKQANKAIRLLLESLINECEELNQWMALEEFLKCGYKGHCWVTDIKGKVWARDFSGTYFTNPHMPYPMHEEIITHVMPIHKPEPPR